MCVVEFDGSLERKKENDKMGKYFFVCGYNFKNVIMIIKVQLKLKMYYYY